MKTAGTKLLPISIVVILIIAAAIAIGLLSHYKSRVQIPSASTFLTERGLPPLPASAKIDHLAYGGWIERFLFIKATLSEPDFLQYKEAVAIRYKQWAPNGPGDGSGEGRIERGVTDEPAAAPGKYASWFTPGKIQKGYRYDWDDGRDAWSIYFDEGERIVYIRWTNN